MRVRAAHGRTCASVSKDLLAIMFQLHQPIRAFPRNKFLLIRRQHSRDLAAKPVRSLVSDVYVHVCLAPHVFEQLKYAYTLHNERTIASQSGADNSCDFFRSSIKTVIAQQVEIRFKERTVEIPRQESSESGLSI